MPSDPNRVMSEATLANPLAKILHVDDDEANRYAITRTLIRAGYEVVEAANGVGAIERATNSLPDLVILDVRLPDIDGFEVCRRLKADPLTAAIPVLHLSASFVTSDDRAHGLNTGADGYLVRPVAPGELVATINALLRVRRSEEALRASEERFRAAFAGAAVGMILTDLRGQIAQANPAACTMTGYEREELIKLDLRTLTHPDDRDESDRLVRQMIDEHVASVTVEKRYLRREGSDVWVQETLSLARDPSGRPANLVVMTQDITDRRRAEEALVAAKDEAEAARTNAETANRLKDDFLATLSHELRTPLTAIVGWASLLRRGGRLSEAERDEGLRTIERNAKVQAQLIEDLLDVSRIISGKLRLEMQRVALVGVIDAALAAVRPAAQTRGVTLNREIDDTLQLQVWGDPSRLQQVFWNLLTNAIKFSPEQGSVTLRLALDDDGQSATITVIDTGKGIEPDFLPYVFERFRQADGSTKRSQGGLGLGLAIVRQLVDLHRGTVAAQSGGFGQGAEFAVHLPLATDESDEAPANPTTANPTAVSDGETEESVLKGLSILVVEDDDDCRKLAQHILRSVGATVSAASSVAQAMSFVREQRFSLIISDIGMPNEDGFDLIRQLRALPADQGGTTPAAALSAFAQNATRQRMIEGGFQEPITKPVDPGELIAAVRRLCGR